jgi:hypothetical protein
MIKKQDFNQCIEDMMSGKTKYERVGGVFLKDLKTRTRYGTIENWYVEFGKFIIDNISDEEPIPLNFYYDLKIDPSNIGVKKADVVIPFNMNYQFIGISSVHEFLSKNVLRKAFGKPLFHNHFGEGFDQKSKSSYASYFFKINDINFHIGYDHRGTEIEVESGISSVDVFEALKYLYTEIWKDLIDQ